MTKPPNNILTTIRTNDQIDFVVGSKNDISCLSTFYSNKISQIETSGITATVAGYLARAAIMYFGRCLAGPMTANLQELNLAYALFNFASPVTQLHNGKNRLLIRKSINSRLQAVITETLAIGAALLAGERIFSIPFRYWRPTPKLGRFDFEAGHDKCKFGLEAKGRISENNLISAAKSIGKKFKITRNRKDYHHALGVIYSPTINKGVLQKFNSHDIIVVDPANDIPLLDGLEGLRSILHHYSFFFKAQGYSDVYNQIIKITRAENRSLLEIYIRRGMEELSPGKKWRTSFFIRDVEYVGTAWSDRILLNDGIETEHWSGAYIWGLKRSVNDAIIKGNYESLSKEQHEEDDFWYGQYRYIALNDGSCIGWAPSIEDLLKM